MCATLKPRPKARVGDDRNIRLCQPSTLNIPSLVLPSISKTLLSFLVMIAGAQVHLPTALKNRALKHSFLLALSQIDDMSNKCN